MKKRSCSRQSPKSGLSQTGKITCHYRDGYCILSHEGEILREGQVATTKAGMTGKFRAGEDRDRSRDAFSLGEPVIAEFWA